MFYWIVSDTYQYLEPFNFDLSKTVLLEIEVFDHLTVGKQMIDVLLNC